MSYNNVFTDSKPAAYAQTLNEFKALATLKRWGEMKNPEDKETLLLNFMRSKKLSVSVQPNQLQIAMGMWNPALQRAEDWFTMCLIIDTLNKSGS